MRVGLEPRRREPTYSELYGLEIGFAILLIGLGVLMLGPIFLSFQEWAVEYWQPTCECCLHDLGSNGPQP